jgi:hypothetical protein
MGFETSEHAKAKCLRFQNMFTVTMSIIFHSCIKINLTKRAADVTWTETKIVIIFRILYYVPSYIYIYI